MALSESGKKARLDVAYEGLLFLTRVNKTQAAGVHRNELFRVTDENDNSADHLAALRAGKWQREYVKRLVEDQVLVHSRKDSEDLYEPKSLARVLNILRDHDAYGLKLSKYMFPGEVTIPNETTDAPSPFDRKPKEPTPEPDPEDDKVLDNRSAKDALLVVLDTMDRINDGMGSLVPLLQKLVEGQAEMSNLTEAHKRSYDENSASLKKRFNEFDKRLEHIEGATSNTSAIAKKLPSRESLIEAIAKVLSEGMPKLDADGRTIVAFDVSALDEALGSMNSMLKQAYAKVCELDSTLQAERKDRTKRAVQDMQSGLDMILEAAAALQKQTDG